MRRLLLPLILVVGFVIFSAPSVNAQTQFQPICAFSTIPVGWIVVGMQNNPITCGNPTNPADMNVWLIDRYDNKFRDARMTVCRNPIRSGAPGGALPPNWAVEFELNDPNRCNRSTTPGDRNISIIKCLNCPTPPPPPHPGPDYEGFFDSVTCNEIQGWVWNKNAATTPLRVDILINEAVFTQVMADQFRQDLLNAGKGDGRHAFRFEMPARLKNSRLNTIKIRVTGTNFFLNPTRSFTCMNPIDTTDFFVKQHYRDFLSREADPGGLSHWSNEINKCGTDAACIDHMRTQVSKAFFLSIEFQETGFFLTKFYKAAFARMPTVAEFSTDKNLISAGVIVGPPGWDTLLNANKQTYTNTFVSRPAFVAAFGPLLNHEYVDRLFANAGISDSTLRNTLINELNTGQASRASVLRRVVDDSGFHQRETNPAFVMMQYIGYLRRHPSDPPDGPSMPGFFFWLSKLNSQNNQNEMVKAFITSIEYRNRFGSDIPFPASGTSTQSISSPEPLPPCQDSDGDGYCDENDCKPFDRTVFRCF